MTCFAHDGEILDALEQDGEEERDQRQEVNKVHPVQEELELPGAAGQPQEVLQREVDGAPVVHEVDGVGHLRVLRHTRPLVNLNTDHDLK